MLDIGRLDANNVVIVFSSESEAQELKLMAALYDSNRDDVGHIRGPSAITARVIFAALGFFMVYDNNFN
nr:hypothetical protein CTI12_AA481920 [Tanacetum cinerariifolium]